MQPAFFSGQEPNRTAVALVPRGLLILIEKQEAVEGECVWALEPGGPDSKPVLLLCDFGQVTEPL